MSPRPVKSLASTSADQKPAPRRTQQERSAQAESALLDAAATLFSRRGVDQTSLAEVGELAGYSRGLANHHFGTKATLIERLARRTQTAFVADLDEPGDNALEVLVTLADNYLVTIADGSEATRAFFVMWGAAIASDAPLRAVFAPDDAQFRFGVEAVLRAGQGDKTVAADVDPVLGAVTLVGMLRGVGAQYLVDPDAFDVTAARQATELFVRRAFGAAAKRSRAKS